MDHPVRPCAPTVPVNEERVVGVAKQEFLSDTFDVNRLDVLLAVHKVERSVGLVKKRLCFERFKGYDFKPTETADTEFRAQEVD